MTFSSLYLCSILHSLYSISFRPLINLLWLLYFLISLECKEDPKCNTTKNISSWLVSASCRRGMLLSFNYSFILSLSLFISMLFDNLFVFYFLLLFHYSFDIYFLGRENVNWKWNLWFIKMERNFWKLSFSFIHWHGQEIRCLLWNVNKITIKRSHWPLFQTNGIKFKQK